ncbi:hypothetical protein MKW98_000784 [Papaver atlanticum]|uniref:Uncharacterized protein n=1 Tax=Papaver atlanticum TaxID=357466 RepID=A0AAD4XCG3_9MAGN|nr:hypothetical protein MKW98_000784 [Papaver atlanticum]
MDHKLYLQLNFRSPLILPLPPVSAKLDLKFRQSLSEKSRFTATLSTEKRLPLNLIWIYYNSLLHSFGILEVELFPSNYQYTGDKFSRMWISFRV